ncbi:unnamed protein product, partial [Urochloa humidicola]
ASSNRPSCSPAPIYIVPGPPWPLRTAVASPSLASTHGGRAATWGPRHPLEPSPAWYVPEAGGHELVDLNLGERQLLKGWPELVGDMPASARAPP